MKFPPRLRVITLLSLASLMAAGSAIADRDDAPGQQRKRQGADAAPAQMQIQTQASSGGSIRTEIRIGAVFGARDREVVRDYYEQRYQQTRNCPPGLAKKNNGCLPPGQARKFAVGQPLPGDVAWYPVPPVLVQRLPPLPPDHGYIRIGADIVLWQPRTRLVVDAVLPL